MTARVDLIVIGAGISGLATALWLFQSGLKPAVIPGPRMNDLLSPLDLSLALPWRQHRVVNQLEVRGMTLMRELLTHLSQATGVDLPMEGRDLLVPAAIVERELPLQAADSMELVQGPAATFDPQLAEGHEQIWCLPGRAEVRSDRLMRALHLDLMRRGVDIFENRSVRRLEVSGNIVLGVEMNDREFIAADATILATDQASAAILKDSGLEAIEGGADLMPALQFAPSSASLRCALIESAFLMAPRADGRLVASSHFDSTQTEALPLDELCGQVYRRLPGLGRHDLEQSGRLPTPGSVRKVSVGAYPGVRGLWLNLGHEALGPVIAPAAAEFLTEQLAGGRAVDAIKPTLSRSLQPSC